MIESRSTPKSRISKRLLAGYLTAGMLMGCGTVAITGRSQLNLVSDSELIKAADQNFAQLMTTANSKGAVLNSSESAEAANILAMVNRVSNRIIDAAELRGKYNWQVTVLKSDVPNAFVMPNGKIVVYTGLLPIVKTEAGLAAAVGHEVAHVVARHSAERMSQQLLAKAAVEAVDDVAAAKGDRRGVLIAAALGVGAQYGILLPFSRAHESEADRIGQIYMARAGYDPAEAIGVWERMAEKSGGSKFEFTSTHPSDITRQNQLRQWLPEAQLYYTDRNRPLPKNINELQVAAASNAQRTTVAPVALQPAIQPGFWYKTKALGTGVETTFTFEKITPCELGECVTVESSAHGKRTTTTDFRISRVDHPNGTWTKYSPPVRPVVFPLKVGNSWEDKTEVETSDGKKRSVVFKTQVIAFDSITVPAGTFMGYKVAISVGGAKFFEGWYVPETRAFVHSSNFNSSGSASVSVLTDYQKTDDVSGTLAMVADRSSGASANQSGSLKGAGSCSTNSDCSSDMYCVRRTGTCQKK